ncbi:centrin-3-like [Pecten maximus]|uniref:centrin-3-like n=1 Tax=Pecten maximus TaxID=6579 RepID=UPI00145812FB|nr:centrin-3-like [Pecten maximus]
MPAEFALKKGKKKKKRELAEEQKQEIQEAFDLFDTDKDRAIDYHELKVRFLTDMMLERDPQEEVQKGSKLFDDDLSGKICLRNLRRTARELGENMTDEQLRAMIDELDREADGEKRKKAEEKV